MDLASFELIHSSQDSLLALLHEHSLDIVFCNEEEAVAIAEARLLVLFLYYLLLFVPSSLRYEEPCPH